MNGPAIRTFSRADAVYQTFRSAGPGSRQDVCEWIGPADGAPFQGGIAELTRIRINDYTFGIDDFLYVLEGGITLRQGTAETVLGPGTGVYIPKGATVTLEVPDRLLWIYCAYGAGGHWKDAIAAEPVIEAL